MGRILRSVSVLLAVLVCGTLGYLLAPSSALAKSKGVAPPGNSGVSQYMEDLPTVSGSKPTSSIVVAAKGGGGSGPSAPGGANSSSAVPKSVAKQLDKAGSVGQSAAALARATAPVVSKAKPTASTQPTASSEPTASTQPSPTKPSAAPASAVLRSLAGSTGGGGLGAFLPVILIATLVIVSAIGIFHRRTPT